MKISNFKYILTDLGGGWSTVHKFYGVTPTGDVYTTENFNDTIFQLSTELDCELLGHLDSIELGLKDDSEIHYGVMDASDLTVYEVGKTYKILHYAPEISVNNPKLYEDIQRLVLAYNDKKAQKIIDSGKFIVGEINTTKEFREVLELLKTGYSVHTTFHASDNLELIDNIAEQLMNDNNTELDFGLHYGKKFSDEVQHKLRETYFKNQPNTKEFFNNIGNEVNKKDSTEPTMRDLFVHLLSCSVERTEPINNKCVKSEFEISPLGYGTLSGNYLVKGNHKVEHEIKELTRQFIIDKISLYDAQSSIKEQLIEKYGADFYDKNADAINFIIEGTYSDYQSGRLNDWL